MIPRDDEFERRVAAWFREDAPGAEPRGLLDAILSRTAQARRRPGWMTQERWLPTLAWPQRVASVSRSAWVFVILAALFVGLAVAALVVGSQRRLPPPFGPARTGMLVFDAGGDIVTARVDGSDRRTLTADPALETSPSFSPDGTKIAYWYRSAQGWPASLWVMNVDGSDQHKVTGGADLSGNENLQAAWAPDSRRLAFSVGDYLSSSRLYVVNANGTGLDPIGGGSLARSDPAWSPDGRLIAFRGQETGVPTDDPPDNPLIGVYVMAPDGTGERKVSRLPGAGGSPSWAFGWPLIVSAPSWSPDGTSLVYSVGTRTDHRLAVAAVDGSSERILPVAQPDALMPTYSPSGNRIAFERRAVLADGSEVADIFVIDADGTSLRQLNVGPKVAFGPLSWSPDGHFLLGYPLSSPGLLLLPVDRASPGSVIDAALVPAGASSSYGFFQRASWQRLAP
jgi:hypothetical protein